MILNDILLLNLSTNYKAPKTVALWANIGYCLPLTAASGDTCKSTVVFQCSKKRKITFTKCFTTKQIK